MLPGLATYRLALGQARQDDLLGLIPERPASRIESSSPLSGVKRYTMYSRWVQTLWLPQQSRRDQIQDGHSFTRGFGAQGRKCGLLGSEGFTDIGRGP